MLRVKYFSYGSNIDINRLKGRVEFLDEPVLRGEPYILNNYELKFNAGIRFSTFAFANIEYRKGAKVEGILYDITPNQFSKLDRCEVFYDKHYFQIDENTIGCTYIAKPKTTLQKEAKPDLSYLNVIIDGCKNNGLSNTYEKLVRFKLANYKIRKSKHKL